MSVTKLNMIAESQTAEASSPARFESAISPQRSQKRAPIRRIQTRQICQFSRQLATLLRAGMPLVPALSALLQQFQRNASEATIWPREKDESLKEVIRSLRERISHGSSFADALSEHPDVFPPLYVSMVAAGQAGGALDPALVRLADMLEKRVQLAGKVKAAIAYPAVMAIVAFGVVGFLLTVVVPGITQIFVEMNRALPWPTTLLISVCGFLRDQALVLALALGALLFGLGAGCRTKEGRLLLDRLRLRAPLFGALFRKVEMARITRTLGVLLASGIPILDALQIARGVTQNGLLAAGLDRVRDLVHRGDTLADAIDRTGLFPPVVSHVIATGQMSGNVEQGLSELAQMYDNEVELTTKTLVSLLEPLVLLVMGVIVGFIVLAVLLPIFEINQAL